MPFTPRGALEWKSGNVRHLRDQQTIHPPSGKRIFGNSHCAKSNTIDWRRTPKRNGYSELQDERCTAHHGSSSEMAHILSSEKSFCEVIKRLCVGVYSTGHQATHIARKGLLAQGTYPLNATITIRTNFEVVSLSSSSRNSVDGVRPFFSYRSEIITNDQKFSWKFPVRHETGITSLAPPFPMIPV